MDILTRLSGILILLGVILSICSFLLLPQIKRSGAALITVTIGAGLLAFSAILLGLVHMLYVRAPAPDAAAPASGEIAVIAEPDPLPARPVQEKLTTTVNLQETLSEYAHPFQTTTRAYQFTIPAESGYKIVEAQIKEKSANKLSNLSIGKAPDGSAVSVAFKLTSGTQFDRWRGWIDADLQLTQIKVDTPPVESVPQ